MSNNFRVETFGGIRTVLLLELSKVGANWIPGGNRILIPLGYIFLIAPVRRQVLPYSFRMDMTKVLGCILVCSIVSPARNVSDDIDFLLVAIIISTIYLLLAFYLKSMSRKLQVSTMAIDQLHFQKIIISLILIVRPWFYLSWIQKALAYNLCSDHFFDILNSFCSKPNKFKNHKFWQ